MATAGMPIPSRAITSLRWWIGAILFASTIINYIDRQTLSLVFRSLRQHTTTHLALLARCSIRSGTPTFSSPNN
jgi:hypothetical protein